MKNLPLLRTVAPRQQGISLIESLVAMVILALGVMGLLGVQLRTLSDQQQGVQRGVAMRLADELFERIKANPDNVISITAPLGAAQWAWLANYVIAWGVVPANNPDCVGNACNGALRAQWDIRRWHQSVASSLPGGNAQVLLSPDPRQMIVIIGWTLKESGADAGLLAPFALNIPGVAAPAACGTTHICHVAYGQP